MIDPSAPLFVVQGSFDDLIIGSLGLVITIVLLSLIAYRQLAADLGMGSPKTRTLVDYAIATLLGMFLIDVALIIMP